MIAGALRLSKLTGQNGSNIPEFLDSWWVHRKGAVFAGMGVQVIIPGSMGTASYLAVGQGCTDALSSCSHGAGRSMNRTEARHAISVRAFEKEMRGVWFDHRLSPRLREEAPAAYKDIHEVMKAQRELVTITRRLRPLLSYKGA
ncbi:hypothetical protein CCP4SC76_8230005 [Gammaproteobacteria bacterium]